MLIDKKRSRDYFKKWRSDQKYYSWLRGAHLNQITVDKLFPTKMSTLPIRTSPIRNSPIRASPIHTSPIRTTPNHTSPNHINHKSPIRTPPIVDKPATVDKPVERKSVSSPATTQLYQQSSYLFGSYPVRPSPHIEEFYKIYPKKKKLDYTALLELGSVKAKQHELYQKKISIDKQNSQKFSQQLKSM